MRRSLTPQVFPILLSVASCIGLCLILFVFVLFLNQLPTAEKIIVKIRPQDILVGMTIYVKTAIDFAIFIGNLMHSNPGQKKRIAIQFGTAIGNGIGTICILLLWTMFKEVPLLLLIMILLASLVLLHMAEESFEELLTKNDLTQKRIRRWVGRLQRGLHAVNMKSHHVMKFIIPETGSLMSKTLPFKELFFFSMTIPFILGLDDFAGYIPLFSVINVIGFGIGVFLAHMLLTITLFLSPTKTTRVVKHWVVLLFGGTAFVLIATWGLIEVVKILLHLI